MHRFLLLPASALLALAVGCGSGGDAAAPGDGVPAGQVPDELVGRWRFEQILDQTCDPDTGLCVPTSAQTETLTLTSQGRFEHVLYAESNFPPCNMVVQHQSEGSADVEASTLSLHITEGVTKVDNTCGESSVTDEGGETDTYTWEIIDGEGGTPELLLTNDRGTKLGPFEPQT